MTILAPNFDEIKEQRLKVQRAENEQKKKSALDVVKSALIPAGISSAIDLVGNSILQDKAQHYYKENQRRLFSMQQQAQQNAASNEVEGLRKAGLSTALAQGASGMSIAGASAPAASTHAASPAPEFGTAASEKAVMNQSIRLSQAEMNVKDAQAELLRSQALGQDLQNDNIQGANYIVQKTFNDFLDNQIVVAESVGDKSTSAALSSLKESLSPYINAGAYQFLQGMLSASGDYSKAISTKITSFLESEVAGKQAASNFLVNEIAIAPFLQNNKVRAEVAELAALQQKLLADTENAKALLPAYKKSLDKLLADIRLSGVKADEIHNSDLQTAIVNDDWGRVTSIVTEDLAKIGANAIGFYMGGKGLGKARAASAPAAAPAAAPASAPAPAAYNYKPQVGGEARKASAPVSQQQMKDAFAPFLHSSQSTYSKEHNDFRRPKTDAFGNKIDYRTKKYRGKK